MNQQASGGNQRIIMQLQAANIYITDSVLSEQCRTGDSAAMELLVLKYQDRIYNAIFRICANSDDAAELTQETFVRLIENIREFDSRSTFYTWAFRIAINLTLNHCQRRSKLGRGSLDTEPGDQMLSAKAHLKQFLDNNSLHDPAILVQKSCTGVQHA